MNSDKFYKELGNIPDPKEDIFNKIEEKIQKSKDKRHKIWSIAASIIIAFGIIAFNTDYNFNNVSSTVSVSEEVAEELQIIDDYLNDTDEEIEMYAYSGIY